MGTRWPETCWATYKGEINIIPKVTSSWSLYPQRNRTSYAATSLARWPGDRLFDTILFLHLDNSKKIPSVWYNIRRGSFPSMFILIHVWTNIHLGAVKPDLRAETLNKAYKQANTKKIWLIRNVRKLMSGRWRERITREKLTSIEGYGNELYYGSSTGQWSLGYCWV